MPVDKTALAVATVSLVSLLAVVSNVDSFESSQKEQNLQAGNSRNFVEWMRTSVPNTGRGSGIKYLVLNINPGYSQQDADQMAIDLTDAATHFPTFCNTGNEEKDMQEFSAFLTIVGAETSYKYNYPLVQENGCPACPACSYNSKGEQCETNPALQYFGRGPLQLSWDYNYAEFSQHMFGNKEELLNNPGKVLESNSLAYASAIWFWQRQNGYGGWCMPQWNWKQHDTCENQCPNGPNGCWEQSCSQDHWIQKGTASCHDAMQTGSGIGEVINIVNGGYDCCPSSTVATAYGHTLYRTWWFVDMYQRWTGQYVYNDLSNIKLGDCPTAKTINCSSMQTGCGWNCCRFN